MGVYRFAGNADMAKDDVIGPITLASDRVAVVGFQTDKDNAANAAYVLEFNMGEDATSSWLTLAAIDPTDNVTVKTSYVGVDKAGVVQFSAGGVKKVRARRTDNNAGKGKGTLVINQL